MNGNWTTNPAYMAVPGNVYHTALDDSPRQERPHGQYGNEMADEGLLFCLVFGALMVLAFFIEMSNGGNKR